MRPAGYWKEWYWKKGGRSKVQARRYIREYEKMKRITKILNHDNIDERDT